MNLKFRYFKIISNVFLLLLVQHCSSISKRGEPNEETYSKYIQMPGAIPTKNDDYLCTAMPLNATIEEWIIMYDPLASANRAHHMLLYGCSGVSQEFLDAKIWDCGHHGICEGNKIIFAWAKNAPGIHLPPDVGFRIGGNSGINFLALQIHYAKPLPDGLKDDSGLKMTVTKKAQKYKAGIYLLGSGFVDIPPLTPKTHADSNCKVGSTEPTTINIFGYRVHAHALGSVITGYKYNPKTTELLEIVKGNPQWPQAFYPMESILKVEPDEILHVRCTYNSMTRETHTYIGSTSGDEMCNLYLMYYTDREQGTESGSCWMETYKFVTSLLPSSSDEPLPPNQDLEAMTVGENKNKDKKIVYTPTQIDISSIPKITNTVSDNQIKDNSKKDEITENDLTTYTKKIQMPGVTPEENDAYLCTGLSLNTTKEEWVILFNPMASANRAHHLMLFGCSGINPEFLQQGFWNCGHHGVCDGGRVMYAWAKNAPGTHLPKDVGFRIGGNSGIKYLTLQIHYAKALPKEIKDESGVELTVTTKPQKFKAGIFLLAASYVDIPPYTEKTHADVNCDVGDTEPTNINIFAFRVHAHKLGSVISGYKYTPETNTLIEIAKGNPQWPQAFYPTNKTIQVKPSEVLHARCTFNSTNSIKHTYIGATSDDEMCNLYLMYYTDAVKGSESGGCGDERYRVLTAALPPSSDEPLPPNPELEEMTRGKNRNRDKEVSYSNIYESEKPIEVVKKTQSRKDPQQQGFIDYDYPNYESYDYEQQPQPPSYNSPSRNWNPKAGQDYYSASDAARVAADAARVAADAGRGAAGIVREGKYRLKPKPVELYNEYERGDSSAVGKVEYFGKNLNRQPSPEHNVETLVNSRQGKKLESDYSLVDNWGPKKYKMGQVVAVAIDSRGDVVIFHRGEKVWDGSTFHLNNLVNQKDPIAQPTLLHLQKDSGSVMHEWGANFFFMPHGLFIDSEDNIWLTDVGMHQIFKFPSGFGEGKPILTLGTKFISGNDDTHFCKPTDVLVLKNGEFFVSDGYCNSRIIHYSATGQKIKQFGEFSGYSEDPPKEGTFSIPHAMALLEDEGQICVADRENGRIQCFKIDSGKFQKIFQLPEWGKRLFSVAYTKNLGGKLFCVNGPQFTTEQKLEIFEVDFKTEKLISSFSPHNQGLSNPHDLAISQNGDELYVVEIGPNAIWKFVSETDQKNGSSVKVREHPNLEVKTGQLKEDSHNTLNLFSGGYSSLGVSSVILGLVAVPILVLSALAVVMRCRKKGVGNRYSDNAKLMSGFNGKQKNGGLDLGSLLNKRRGFEQVATNDIDADDLDSADSDVEEFSLAATKV